MVERKEESRDFMDSEKKIELAMYQKAIAFIPERYPSGWGGVAIIRTDDGHYFTSVSIETANASVDLCIEVGAMCDAHKYNKRVTHCICVVRDDETSPFKVLSPCGVCQERLRFWGEDVKVGVTTTDNLLTFVRLEELQPYHWTRAYPAEEIEHYQK
ncbi:cytidine deaminase [Shouchella sp. JSM 1781072]|uniref:cytidine deaminase n=2 Tax=Bacillales TaxID=1385 RepID=UPI0020D1C763|nr:cytidine deaminase [Alkalihalobacillus sp. LMS6]UTR07112.1 cytidine deaminase [Alkalihalobacillus sp. LMS6]